VHQVGYFQGLYRDAQLTEHKIINLQVLETGSLPSGARGAVSPTPPTQLNKKNDLASKTFLVFNLGSWKCPQY
jgi:hypothetical protein